MTDTTIRKKLTQIPISYSQLFDLDSLKSIVERHQTLINTNNTDIYKVTEQNSEFDIYSETWNNLRFKHLFNNDYDLYSIWLDIVSTPYVDNYFYKLEYDELTENDIKNNLDYKNIYHQYCEAGKSVEVMMNNLEPPKEVLDISDIYSIIDRNIQQLPKFNITTPSYVILVARNANLLISLKKELILTKNARVRDTIYHHVREGNLFVSIIDY